MILAIHSIFSTYGTWLPNEPRGSLSTFVASWELFRYGPATTVGPNDFVARKPYDRTLKKQMQSGLKRAPVRFTIPQIRVLGDSLRNLPYTFHALAVMPDHVHAIIGRTCRDIRHVIGHIKSEMTRALRANAWFTDRSPWAQHGWNIFLDSDKDVIRSIDYTNRNPARDGLPTQQWSFIQPFVPEEFSASDTRRKRRG
jgi:REP element-mobilizing transposase RayT